MRHEPTFKPIFGSSWETLPAALKLHYANRPFTQDVVKVKGLLDVTSSPLMRLFAPLMKWAGLLTPYVGTQIPAEVYFRSFPDSDIFCFDRSFYFPGKPACHFRSQMTPVGGDEVIEFMSFGIGWKAAYRFVDDKVVILHRGYVWRILGMKIPMPFHLIFGRGYAEEQATSNTSFRMLMQIRHPWLGTIYEYRGSFEIKEVTLEP